LRRFQASFWWFFFFLLVHVSMMSDLTMDVVDAHDAVVSEGHPVSSPPASENIVLDVDSTSSCRGGRCRRLYLECAMLSYMRRSVWKIFNVHSPSMRPTKVTSKAKQHSKSSQFLEFMA
jgi:hypothetical protein